MIRAIPNAIDACNNDNFDATSNSSSPWLNLELNSVMSGTRPSNFTNLKSLEVLHLSNNLLRGSL